MVWSRFPERRKIVISFESSPNIAELLMELCAHYHMPKKDVIECLIAQEHESVGVKEKVRNDFVLTPPDPSWE